ncbi:MAG TPA: c-type cytochrome [Ferruginibacter sp.]|nr:c-type cytochrome [Ferruginibacter sp.]HMP19331.1 c-type cytochrome [Ferruginibacter sp.]
MKKQILFITVMAAAVAVVMFACNTKAGNKKGETDFTNKELIERGAYLVNIAVCDDCHTPKKMGPNGPELDMERRFSGYRQGVPFPKVDTNLIKEGWTLANPELTGWAGPWGASFTANITSDETGIGNWTFDQFKKAFQQGKWKGMDNGRPLMPPMPWQQYSNMTEDDVKAVFAFLKSTKPVKNVEPPIKPLSEL